MSETNWKAIECQQGKAEPGRTPSDGLKAKSAEHSDAVLS